MEQGLRKYRRHTIWIGASVVAGVSYASTANAQDALEQQVSELKALLTTVEEKLRSVRTENAEILKRLTELEERPEFPDGLVVASTRPCSEWGDNWDSYQQAAGKFLLGAGAGVLRYRGPHRPERVGSVVELTPVEAGDEGGEERHILNVVELPEHNHHISASHNPKQHDGLAGSENPFGIDRDFREDVVSGSWGRLTKVISKEGGGKAHNNMPPYTALYFCKLKEPG